MRIFLIILCVSVSLFGAKTKRAPAIPRKATIDKTAKTYTVEEGDWLSSIAESYFGNKEDWKKIQEENPDIKNPDLIHPGDVISFAELEEMRKTASVNQDLPTLVPVLKPRLKEPKEIEVEQPLERVDSAETKIRVKYFILGQEELVGEVTGSSEERRFFVPGDSIFIKALDLSKFKVGTRVSIAKPVGELEDKTVSKSMNLGSLMELVGEVEIIEWGDKFVKTEVVETYGKMERGDKVTPLIPSVRLGDKINPPADLLMKVVMAEEVTARFAGNGSLILLNKGWEHSVAPDQYFRIYTDIDPITKSYKNLEPESKGEVQIVYAGKTASVGLVTKAMKPIVIGDALVPYQHFRDPKPIPRKEIETIEIN